MAEKYTYMKETFRKRLAFEAAELARRSIYQATFRDGASGGVASVYYVGPDGWKKLSGDDVGELHYHYYPVMPSTVEQEMVEVTGA
ncbi:hypothetical protein ACB098_12G171600 [Castanea mollissima]